MLSFDAVLPAFLLKSFDFELLLSFFIFGSVAARRPDMATHHILLVEPFPDLRDVLRDLMQDAGWIVDVAMTAYEMRLAIAQTSYDCVFLNLDQGRPKNFGLELADDAAAQGARIVMIPDNAIDPAVIAAKGWLQFRKPFKVAEMQAVLGQALGPAGEAAAIQQRADDFAADMS